MNTLTLTLSAFQALSLKQKIALAAGVPFSGFLALAVAGPLLAPSPDRAVLESPAAPAADTGAILDHGNLTASQVEENAALLTAEVRKAVRGQEALRFLEEARKQAAGEQFPCFRLGVHCALDQFAADASRQLRDARDSRDWAAVDAALDRAEIVAIAREIADGKAFLPAEPPLNLAAQALDAHLDKVQEMRATEDEAIAASLEELSSAP